MWSGVRADSVVPGGRVRARELDERRRAARVVVRAGASTCVVSMGNDDDRLVERSLDDGRQIAELDLSDPGDVVAPAVLLDPEAVQRELVAEPVGRATGAERARYAARVVTRELDGQRGRGGRVERRGQRRRRQRAGSRDRDHGEQQREDDEQPRACARGACSAVARPSRASASARLWSRRDHEVRGGLAPSRGL